MSLTETIEIPLNELIVGDSNVRRDVGDVSELASSVREHGVLLPIIVRMAGSFYEVVAGSRRLEAAHLAGLETIPAIVKELSDSEALTESLVENLQRGDLDVEEEAMAYERLLEELDSVARVAERVNKTATHVRRMLDALNAIRVLSPAGIKIGVTTRFSHEQQERENTKLLPIRHATVLEAAFRVPEVASHYSEQAEREQKYIELARAISPLTQRHAEMVIDRFKRSPERAIPEIVEEVVHPVDIRMRLAPDLANKLDDLAQGDGLAYEDVLEDMVHSYVGMREGSKPDSSPRQLTTIPQGTGTETHEPPLRDLVHGKIEWNLRRLPLHQYDYFTIGYSGRSLSQAMEVLQIADVRFLIDVRNYPFSRHRPEFSRDNLANEATSRGIEYMSWPDMGVPQQIRASYGLADLFKWYDSEVLPGKLTNLNLKRCAFLCTEVDPHFCHRHRIALYLEQKGYQVLDL